MRVEIGLNESGQRLDKFSRKLFKDVPMGVIYKAIRKGDIRVNDKKAKEKYILEDGDVFTSKYVQSERVKNIGENEYIKVDKNKLKIVYEDKNVLLVEKWPGVLVHGDSKNTQPTLSDHVLSYLDEKGEYTPESEVTFKPSPCNRLDANTSGMVLFAKNFQATKILNEMIREKDLQKYYVALVKGRIKDGLYEGYIKKNEEKNISKVYEKNVPNSKKISMEIKTLETVGSFSFIEINLITGRSHQIRAHLSYLGNSIIGDSKYGDKKLNSFFDNKFGLEFQFLYAYKYVFKNCSGELEYLENKSVTAALPPMFKKIKKDVMRF